MSFCDRLIRLRIRLSVNHSGLFSSLTPRVAGQLPHRAATPFAALHHAIFEVLHHNSLEVFCGPEQLADELGGASPTQYSADPNSGPPAVLRNLGKVLLALEKGVFHAVVTDMFTPLSNSLHNSINTIQINKKHFPPALITKDPARPAEVARGSSTVAVAKRCPKLKAMLWWDSLPVYLLSTESSTLVDSCDLTHNIIHVPGGRKVTIPCPSAGHSRSYRLQRYLLQLAVCFRKYYKTKTIVLGLVDMAITNAFMVHREAQVLHVQGRFIEEAYTAWLLTNARYILHIALRSLFQIVPPSTAMPTPESNAIPREHRLTEFPD
ncbi:hypothetical protein PHMEG_00033549 [Phytophthora megakarya]|uniref:PiggyBac transposable element-derived protein domain-containing protein n=1 Tax=Phytophthora megakarya TaxID=4795 RepID=A0A225USX6_9STRA|nr:hypothetical protein PHMEG_00033549 [Phytophthora megakarya]